ncbi:MAG: amidohydrolase family protein [Sinobacteraceae bacterium]|nr:amidohydrolase family protein [Nevskiaceae bacterium]
MPPVDLLISPRWTLPIEPEGAVLEGYSTAVHAGRIVEIGPTAALLERYQPAMHVVRAQHVLLPGLVDAHTHAARSLLRDALPRGPLAPSLDASLRRLEQRWASAEFVRAGTLHAITEMLRAGITCFADTSLFPEEVARLAGELRMRIAVGLPISESPTPWSEDAADALDRAATLWDAHKSDPWARLQFMPDPAGTVTRDTLERLRRIADQLDAPVAMRVHDDPATLQAFEHAQGERPLPWLGALGLLRPGFVALQANHLLATEIELLARSGVGVVHCPTAGLRLAQGVAPLAALRARGVCTALGSDPAMAGLGTADLLAEARLASLLAGAHGAAEPGVPDAHAALRMATLEGARTLGFDTEIGSIVPGKSADLVCVDLAVSGVGNATRVAEALLFNGSARDVSDVWVAGRAQLAARELCLIEAEQVAETARQWSARLRTGEQR